MNKVSYKVSEVWYQDSVEADLWNNDKGLLVNTAALNEREAFFEVTRVAFTPVLDTVTGSSGQRI